RAAFQKTREDMLKKMNRWENESEAEFGHRKEITKQMLMNVGNLLAEASEARIDWNTSHAKKRAHLGVELKAEAKSPLAARIGKIGKTPDEFAGVSKEECVAWATINLPLDERRQESIKVVARHGRAAGKERIAGTSGAESRKAGFADLSDLVADIADDVAGRPRV